MKRYIKSALAACTALIMMCSLAGCGEDNKEINFKPDETSIYVCDDGTILGATVESFSEPYYNISDLESFVSEQVVKYNEDKVGISSAYAVSADTENPVNLPISIENCYLEGNNAVLILACKSYSDYYMINNLDEYNEVISAVEVSTIKELKDDGRSISAGLFDVKGSGVNTDKVMKKNKYHVIKASGYGTVYVQGFIKYASGDVKINEGATSAVINGTESYIIYK